MARFRFGVPLVIVGLCALLLLTAGEDSASAPSSIFVSIDKYGNSILGDICLEKCIGCPFHDHRYFYKYSPYQPTVETDTKGIFPVFYGGEVISRLGDGRDEGRIHRGIDIAGKMGDPIVAAWTGTVQYAGWNRLGGWVVVMKHGNGYYTYYAHLKDKPAVRPGQRIIAGQRLGALGNSGNAQNSVPHLHFEVIKRGGRVVNPLHVL